MLFSANTIVLGSFQESITAKKYLKNMLKSLKSNEQIVKMQSEHNLYFAVRTSRVPKMSMVTLEPFNDRRVLKNVLEAMRTIRSDAYVITLKKQYTFVEKEYIVSEIEKAQKNIPIEILSTSKKITPIKKKEEFLEGNSEITAAINTTQNSVTADILTFVKKIALIQKKENSLEKKNETEISYDIYYLLLLLLFITLALIGFSQAKKRRMKVNHKLRLIPLLSFV